MGAAKPSRAVVPGGIGGVPLALLKDPKVTTGLAIATSAVSVGRWIIDKKKTYDERHRYTASVKEGAYIYRPLMAWINEQVDARKVIMHSKYAGITRFYDGDLTVTVNIKGFPLYVKVQKPDTDKLDMAVLANGDSSFFAKSIVFTTMDKRGIDALEAFLEELTNKQKNEERDVLLYNTNQYGHWDGKAFERRHIDSVVLPLGVMEDLIQDIDVFLANEERYGFIGLPWHRGYLLHGEPGNGKSSLVKALASTYHFSLYNFPLSGVKDDKALVEYISRIDAKSILLLEDIDIFSKSMKREQADTGPTLAGLLNALDGVSTPHGLITFITTNKKNSLDPTLIRPGRVDYSIELNAPDLYQIEKMYFRVYEEILNVPPRDFESMAELVEVFKSNPNDAEAARLLIKRS